MYLNPTGVSCNSTPCFSRQRVDQIRGRNRFGHAILPAPALHQIIKQQRDHIIRLQKSSIGVDNAKTVGVAIRRNPNLRPSLAHLLSQIFQQMIVRLRRMPAEQHVAIIMHGRDLQARAAQQFVRISASRAPHRIKRDPQIRLANHFQIDNLSQPLQISPASDPDFHASPLHRRRQPGTASSPATISASIFFVTSGRAGQPSAVENLIPLYSGGLCDAVKLMTPSALFWITA